MCSYNSDETGSELCKCILEKNGIKYNDIEYIHMEMSRTKEKKIRNNFFVGVKREFLKFIESYN